MKNFIYTLTLVLLVNVNVAAQNKRITREEFQNKQKEFFIQEAQLTQDEAAKFFPIYFTLQEKKGKLNQEAMEQIRKGKNGNLTEAEYNRIVENVLKSRITSDELELEYLKKYRKFLSAQKIYQLQRAEMRFHREILKEAKRKK